LALLTRISNRVSLGREVYLEVGKKPNFWGRFKEVSRNFGNGFQRSSFFGERRLNKGLEERFRKEGDC